MNISKDLYETMQKQTAPKSKSWKNIPLAFCIGGLICTIGEIGIHILTEFWGIDNKTASAWISIGLVALSALLTGLGLYAKLGKFAGAGTLVPITGFANGVVSSAMESRSEGWILGIGTKIFSLAGPVILYGTSASILYGLIYYLWQLFQPLWK